MAQSPLGSLSEIHLLVERVSSEVISYMGHRALGQWE